jgi:hypothetical protein
MNLNNFVERMMFVYGVSGRAASIVADVGDHQRTSVCPNCQGRFWKYESCDPYLVLHGAQNCWPDFLCGKEIVVAESVVSQMAEAGITGVESVPLRILRNEVKEPTTKPPAYFLLRVLGSIDIERRFFDEFEGTVCAECGSWTAKKGGNYKRFGDKTLIPNIESWSGDDFVRISNIRLGFYRFCRPSVINLAIECRWSGCEFGEQIPHLIVSTDTVNWAKELKPRISEKIKKTFSVES